MYAAVDDIIEALTLRVVLDLVDDENTGPLTAEDQTEQLTPAQHTRVMEKIAAASAEADAFLSMRFSVPLEPVPELVNSKVTDIALYLLTARRRPPDETLKQRYDAAIMLLERIAQGRAKLPGVKAEGSTVSGSTSSGASITSNPRLFTRDRLKGY